MTKGKLFNLKEWLTVPAAAKHLSIIFEEDVSEADVLRLALDGHLKLSVDFVNHASARCGKIVSEEECEPVESYFSREILAMVAKKMGDSPEGKEAMRSARALEAPSVMFFMETALGGGRFLKLEKKVTSISGVWDLLMVGCERLDIEHEYQRLTGGPEVTLTTIDGDVFVEREDGQVCALQESFDNNEYQSGSTAQCEAIKEYIACHNIGEKKSKELLERHNKKRQEYLEKRKKKNPEDDYYSAGGLPKDTVLVVRTQALMDLQDQLSRKEKEKILEPRSERTYLNIIGALLEITTGTFRDERFTSETKLREFIAEKFDDLRGVAPRTLADKFALAKKALNGELD